MLKDAVWYVQVKIKVIQCEWCEVKYELDTFTMSISSKMIVFWLLLLCLFYDLPEI